jgi:hypothetical protein
MYRKSISMIVMGQLGLKEMVANKAATHAINQLALY